MSMYKHEVCTNFIGSSENECDNCDIIENLSKSNATLNITIDQNQNRPTKSTIKFGSSDDVKEEGKDSLKNKLKNKIKNEKVFYPFNGSSWNISFL